MTFFAPLGRHDSQVTVKFCTAKGTEVSSKSVNICSGVSGQNKRQKMPKLPTFSPRRSEPPAPCWKIGRVSADNRSTKVNIWGDSVGKWEIYRQKTRWGIFLKYSDYASSKTTGPIEKNQKGAKMVRTSSIFHAKFGTAVLYFVVLAYTAQQCVVIVWRENFNPKPSIKTRDTKAKRSYIYTVGHKKHTKMCFAITFVKLDGYWTNLADCFLNKFFIKRCKQMSPEPSTSFILSAETWKSLIQLQRMAILLNATSSCHWTKNVES